jgi:hypothetical protein
MRPALTWMLAGLLCLPLLAGANLAAEQTRIDGLIACVAASGISFVRNGTTHNARAAAAHMRMKWGYAGKRITSAEIFIEHIGSRSSTTGEPYRVTLRDGRSLDAGPWLHGLLKEIDAGRSRCARTDKAS